MKPEEKAVIKRVLQFLEVARCSPHPTFNMMVAGDEFEKEVLVPLKELAGWENADKELIKEMARQLEDETKGHSPRERSEKLTKILAISGGITAAIALAGGIALVTHREKEKKKKDNAER